MPAQQGVRACTGLGAAPAWGRLSHQTFLTRIAACRARYCRAHWVARRQRRPKRLASPPLRAAVLVHSMLCCCMSSRTLKVLRAAGGGRRLHAGSPNWNSSGRALDACCAYMLSGLLLCPES